MRISKLDFVPVSVLYTHRENSSQVNRDGVTDVIVKLTTDNGLIGWGESCSGANVESVLETLRAVEPMVLGRDPWSRNALRHDAYHRGLWNFREPTFNFAWAGIDMALWDLCGKAVNQPVYNLLGGLRRREVDYFYYLPFGDLKTLADECRRGVAAGYSVFYIKVGVNLQQEEESLAIVRQEIGPNGRIRVDSNQAWTVAEAQRALALLDKYHIDFAEQPVAAHPIENMLELKAKTPVPLAANEGLWRIVDAWDVIKRRAADVLCFSPFWVGSIALFYELSSAAAIEGLNVCKHTHGELGIAAAACQQALLALPRIVDGHQQTAAMMSDDVLTTPLPIATSPKWGVPAQPLPGLGVEVDEAKVRKYHENYRQIGQYLPYQRDTLAGEDPAWHKPA